MPRLMALHRSAGLSVSVTSAAGTLHCAQADRASRLFDVQLAGEAVAYMANLPLSVNILSQVSAGQ